MEDYIPSFFPTLYLSLFIPLLNLIRQGPGTQIQVGAGNGIERESVSLHMLRRVLYMLGSAGGHVLSDLLQRQ